MQEFAAIYPDSADLVGSTAAARANGYLGGNGSAAQLEDEIGELGLSDAAQQLLRESISR